MCHSILLDCVVWSRSDCNPTHDIDACTLVVIVRLILMCSVLNSAPLVLSEVWIFKGPLLAWRPPNPCALSYLGLSTRWVSPAAVTGPNAGQFALLHVEDHHSSLLFSSLLFPPLPLSYLLSTSYLSRTITRTQWEWPPPSPMSWATTWECPMIQQTAAVDRRHLPEAALWLRQSGEFKQTFAVKPAIQIPSVAV